MDNSAFDKKKGIESFLEDTFRVLHSNPELSLKEEKTQKFILKELQNMGIDAVPIADTGVLGIIRGEKDGKTIALRADMDALPTKEETDLLYKSQNPNVMHACGHDAHMTMLLGAAKILQAKKSQLKGNVKLLFQPAEESKGGALRMIDAGCLENPKVDAVFFGHCAPDYPTGTIAVKSGATSASGVFFTVTFKGKSTHGSMPHKGSDVIVAMSQAIIALQTISSRRTNPTDSVVLSIGYVQAGAARNILPETATFMGMLRTLSSETKEKAVNDFKQILLGVAQAMDVEVDICVKDDYIATINDEKMTELVKSSAIKVLGEDNVKNLPASYLTLEDFSYFCQKVPGCYYHVGTLNEKKGCDKPLHSSRFKVDFDAIVCGTNVFVQIVEDFLNS